LLKDGHRQKACKGQFKEFVGIVSAPSPKRDIPLTPPSQQNSEAQAKPARSAEESLFKAVDNQLASRESMRSSKTFNTITSPLRAVFESAHSRIGFDTKSSPQLADFKIQEKKAKVTIGCRFESPSNSPTPQVIPKMIDIIDLTSDDDNDNDQHDLAAAKSVPTALASPERTLQKTELTVIDSEDGEPQLPSPTPEIVAAQSRARDIIHREQLRFESPNSQEELASVTNDLHLLAEPVLNQPAILLSRPAAKASTFPSSAQYLRGRVSESDSQKLGDKKHFNFQDWEKDIKRFRLRPWQSGKSEDVLKYDINPDIIERNQLAKELDLDSTTIRVCSCGDKPERIEHILT
jgi:hypothetical protein